MPWDRWLRTGLGDLGWSPREFWRATPVELDAAVAGRLEARGVDPERARPVAPPTREDLERMMERFGG